MSPSPSPIPVVEPDETFAVEGHGGAVHTRLWTPAGTPTALIVFVHGYAEYGGRYSHVAAECTARGWAAMAADHVGHGESGGERALITDFALVVDDLAAALDEAVSRLGLDDTTPIVMLGHSMGGLIAARFVQRWPDRLTAAGFLGAVLGDWAWARAVIAEPEMPEEDSDPMGMSRDIDVCRAYADDPLVYRGLYKRPLLVAEVAALDEFRDELDRITIPVAAFHGEADPFVPPGPTVDAVRSMPSTDARVFLYPGAKHELVNETNRDEIVAELLGWVAEVTTSATTLGDDLP